MSQQLIMSNPTFISRLSRSLLATVMGVAYVAPPVSAPAEPLHVTPNTSKWRQIEYITTTIPPAKLFSPEWLAQLATPTDSYWDKVAQCETVSNWKDRGNFAGGLGIAYQTWLGFGGEEFAPKQYEATRDEQIVVANRIALHGYMNSRGQFTEPVGFNGWGCIRNNEYLTPPVGNPWQQANEQS